jgi:hypothetical protein
MQKKYIQTKEIITFDKCSRCKKAPRANYVPVTKEDLIIENQIKLDSICMDCADELGVSEIFWKTK